MRLVNCRTKFEHGSVCLGKQKSLNFMIPSWPEPRQNAQTTILWPPHLARAASHWVLTTCLRCAKLECVRAHSFSHLSVCLYTYMCTYTYMWLPCMQVCYKHVFIFVKYADTEFYQVSPTTIMDHEKHAILIYKWGNQDSERWRDWLSNKSK